MNPLPLLALAASLASAAEVAESTGPAPARAPEPEPNPWSLSYGWDRRGTRYGLDYRIRWDVRDLFESPESLRDNLAKPTDTAESVVYGLLSGARLDVYGVRLRPFKTVRDEPLARLETVSGSTTAVAGSSTAYAGAAPMRRPKLALDPFDDLRRNGRREAERFLLREGFNLAVPEARGAPNWQKEAAGRAVLESGRTWKDDEKPFELPLPPIESEKP